MNLSDFLSQAAYGEGRRLAKEIGVLPVRISDFKSGRRKPSLEQAIKISRATRGLVSLAELRPDICWADLRRMMGRQ